MEIEKAAEGFYQGGHFCVIGFNNNVKANCYVSLTCLFLPLSNSKIIDIIRNQAPKNKNNAHPPAE